jgi:CRISPR system Cascade subunit CasE
MYLSKVFIAFQKPKNIYQIHQDLWATLDHQPQRFLYRIEQQRAGYGAEILLQSTEEPKTTELATIMATRDYSPKLFENQQLRFLLIANPVKTVKDDRQRQNSKGEIKSCRVSLLKEEEQQAWLARKLVGLAMLDSLIIRPCEPLYFYKKGISGGKIIPVAFEGILTVQNPDNLQKIMLKGIGAAKAFGCGLLSIAKA